jgi:hypothetical protein
MDCFITVLNPGYDSSGRPLMHVVDVCEDNLGVLAWTRTDPLTRFRFHLPTRLSAPFDRMMVIFSLIRQWPTGFVYE